MIRAALGIRLIAAVVLLGLFTVVPASAQNPTEECAALGSGYVYVDKIDSINGTGVYTSDEGVDYTVTVTDNPNPTPDSYTLSPEPSSALYPGYTNITQVAKFGEGGGLSHITICGQTGTAPSPTATTPVQPSPTATTPVQPSPTATTPAEPTATTPVQPSPTATTPAEPTATTPAGQPTATTPAQPTATTPGQKPTQIPATKAPVQPTATTAAVALPNTGAGDGSDGDGVFPAMLIGGAALLASVGVLLARQQRATRR